ncbi:Fasciclin-domain-containing protein [Decorospora gaudefroyi]|uniref:Fasciclin-domain-containing protein n=1 Tax=Decorospora gaudefroyi TaxID=184978 RepID=A0A6A5K469_9PLEO|nr:Fasciclin-domain-containing protein [Decorospora gaudefroyi]
MRPSQILSYAVLAGTSLAQGDIGALLASQPELSTLLELVGLIDGLAETLSAASNITIFAPTNDAFAAVPRDVPEGQAIENKNDIIAIGALLANHVFKGVYPASVITDIPTFAQTLLDSSYVNEIQPFSNFTGGAYNELVKNGEDVCVISGEQTISTVTEADIMLGEGITIHKVDTVLAFGAPFQLFTYRSGYFAMNAALEAAQLAIDFGLSGPEATGLNISDFTIFVPTNEAFESIGSVLASADQATLQEVLKYHIIPNNVIFSTALANVTVPSLQGADLVFTVLEDGSAWVNGAKILYANTILFNGVAHVIDGVLSPLAPFDRAALDPAAPASDRLAFEGATSLSALPFTTASLAFGGDLMTYTTTPELLKTVAAVATPTAGLTATTTGAPRETYTGAAMGMLPGAGMAVAGAMGVAAALV